MPGSWQVLLRALDFCAIFIANLNRLLQISSYFPKDMPRHNGCFSGKFSLSGNTPPFFCRSSGDLRSNSLLRIFFGRLRYRTNWSWEKIPAEWDDSAKTARKIFLIASEQHPCGIEALICNQTFPCYLTLIDCRFINLEKSVTCFFAEKQIHLFSHLVTRLYGPRNVGI